MEMLLASTFIAISALGLSAAMISGATLEDRAHRTMAQVATAENLMVEIRLACQADFAAVANKFGDTSVAAHSSLGLQNDQKRLVSVEIPLDENTVPGAIDLDSNGAIDFAVDPTKAFVYVVDVSAVGGLRLRTAVFDPQKLAGVGFDRTKSQGYEPVVYGETRPLTGDPTDTQPSPDPLPVQPIGGDVVTVGAAGIAGKSAEVILVNTSGENRTPVAITIAPAQKDRYFKAIKLNKTTIYSITDTQQPGVVTLMLDTSVSLAPGETTLVVGDFFTMKNGWITKKVPSEVVITVTFDDGSVTTTKVVK